MNQPQPNDDLRDFLVVLRQGLLLVTTYIEKKYDIGEHKKKRVA